MSETRKYNYHDYSGDKVLPDDINSAALEVADKLDPTGKFTLLLKSVQKKKLFGNASYIHPETFNVMGIFEFHNGVCKMFKLIEYIDGTYSHFMRTIINDHVNFKRDNKDNSYRSEKWKN